MVDMAIAMWHNKCVGGRRGHGEGNGTMERKKPILWTDERYAAAHTKKRVVTHKEVSSYATLEQDRDTAIALVAVAMADIPSRTNVMYSRKMAIYTRRTRELALTVGQANWAAAEAEAKVLADDLRAYWAGING